MFDDDFYNEPSEFDQQIEEFKQSLLLKVRDDFKAEMERLRKENAELHEFKRQKRSIEHEINRLKHQSETDKQEAIRQAKKCKAIGITWWIRS